MLGNSARAGRQGGVTAVSAYCESAQRRSSREFLRIRKMSQMWLVGGDALTLNEMWLTSSSFPLWVHVWHLFPVILWGSRYLVQLNACVQLLCGAPPG